MGEVVAHALAGRELGENVPGVAKSKTSGCGSGEGSVGWCQTQWILYVLDGGEEVGLEIVVFRCFRRRLWFRSRQGNQAASVGYKAADLLILRPCRYTIRSRSGRPWLQGPRGHGGEKEVVRESGWYVSQV